MSRVANWNPQRYDAEFAKYAMVRLKDCAEVVAKNARVLCPEGKKSRPVYKTGPYAGEPWTAREAGALKRTIRVVEKREAGTAILVGRNLRVYAGNYLVYYAAIVEFAGRKFMRPALDQSIGEMNQIVEGGP